VETPETARPGFTAQEGGGEGSTGGFIHAGHALYRLSHSPSPFCSGYFGDRPLLFAPADLDHDPPLFYTSRPCWDDRHVPLHPAISLDGGLKNYLPGLASPSQPPKKRGLQAGATAPGWGDEFKF
jgi:hypothetical protein